ncbi:unnamed protein product [Rotaria sp. Silwood1]|nr:unnamed protein product [Rotaria sp. Silwood1]
MTIANHSTECCYLNEDDNEKDQRRKNLLNDPNYGIVLCFLDQFRSVLNLPNYPLQCFEDHLVNYQEPKIKQAVKTSTRRSRKRSFPIEENHNDDHQIPQEESSIDDVCHSIRRSSRLRKTSTSVVTSKTISQFPDAKKKKRSINSKTKISKTRRRRKTTSRRKIEDYFYSSTSSSDEHIDYLSEDEYNSDDYLPNQSQIDMDNNFFELEQEENHEPLCTTKTAQTSTIITSCFDVLTACFISVSILLLCNDCNDGYHLECLHPILLSIPHNDWFCPLCEHKKLSNCLIEKFKELLINLNKNEIKQKIRQSKKSFQRKIKTKIYSSDESLTASEDEYEDLENLIHNEESLLLTSQINDNSNLSSSYFDDNKYTISQRGRHRRIRFNMKQLLDDNNDDEFNQNSDTNDDEYIDHNDSQIENFNLQLPKKITRLLHRRDRSSIKNHQQTKSLTTRLCENSYDLNDTMDLSEKLESPLVYINSDENSQQP